jgi:hypothetical protein
MIHALSVCAPQCALSTPKPRMRYRPSAHWALYPLHLCCFSSQGSSASWPTASLAAMQNSGRFLGCSGRASDTPTREVGEF